MFWSETLLAHPVRKQHEHQQFLVLRFILVAKCVYVCIYIWERDFSFWFKFGLQQQTLLSVDVIPIRIKFPYQGIWRE